MSPSRTTSLTRVEKAARRCVTVKSFCAATKASLSAEASDDPAVALKVFSEHALSQHCPLTAAYVSALSQQARLAQQQQRRRRQQREGEETNGLADFLMYRERVQSQ